MAERELIESYRQGKIGQVTFFRGLVKAGLSVGAALSLALATVPVAAADSPACPPSHALLALGNAATNAPNPETALRLLTVAGNIAIQHPGCATDPNLPPNIPPNLPAPNIP
jgi:hypothetical protein